MSEHTPTPYKASRAMEASRLSDGAIRYEALIYEAEGERKGMGVATAFGLNPALVEANADFIVQAVNAHHELLAAAEEVMVALAEHGPSIVPHLLDSDDNAGQRLRAATFKARGEEVPA